MFVLLPVTSFASATPGLSQSHSLTGASAFGADGSKIWDDLHDLIPILLS